MYTMNQLTLIGFTGQDAETHYTQNGKLVATLSVATKESWKDGDGAWQSRTTWHRVVLFGGLAEYAGTLAEGSLVLVQGAVHAREYEKDGRSTACSRCGPKPSANSTVPNVRQRLSRTSPTDPRNSCAWPTAGQAQPHVDSLCRACSGDRNSERKY